VKYERYIFYSVHIWTPKAPEIEFRNGKNTTKPRKFIALKYYFLKMSLLVQRGEEKVGILDGTAGNPGFSRSRET